MLMGIVGRVIVVFRNIMLRRIYVLFVLVLVLVVLVDLLNVHHVLLTTTYYPILAAP